MDLAAEIIESAHEPQDGFGAVTSGEVIGAEIAVGKAVFQHVISGGSFSQGLSPLISRLDSLPFWSLREIGGRSGGAALAACPQGYAKPG